MDVSVVISVRVGWTSAQVQLETESDAGLEGPEFKVSVIVCLV